MFTCAKLFDGKLALLVNITDLPAEDIVTRYNRWPTNKLRAALAV